MLTQTQLTSNIWCQIECDESNLIQSISLSSTPATISQRPPREIESEIQNCLIKGTSKRLLNQLNWNKLSLFQKKVYQMLATLPAGSTWSYQELANKISLPKAARAVGTAMAKNPFAPIIPCHRIIRKNGDIGQYAYGTSMKSALLHYEKNNTHHSSKDK